MAKKFAIGFIIVAILAAAFFVGGDAPQPVHETAQESETVSPSPSPAVEAMSAESASSPSPGQSAVPAVIISPFPTATPEKTAVLPAPTTAAEATVSPADTVVSPSQSAALPQDADVTEEALTCTIAIECTTILNNMDLLSEEKQELVPENGWVLSSVEVEFYDGETVFNVLQRTVKQYGIHMEYMNTPIYNSAYIEGIANLYEFDCGSLSGWMYSVNGLFPNYGCSRYQIQNGDNIAFIYTCDLGNDIGGDVSAEGQFNKD
ncbi:MAG: DUF4430 domain-containing protein [Oscillospiraceae bacterium]